MCIAAGKHRESLTILVGNFRVQMQSIKYTIIVVLRSHAKEIKPHCRSIHEPIGFRKPHIVDIVHNILLPIDNTKNRQRQILSVNLKLKKKNIQNVVRALDAEFNSYWCWEYIRKSSNNIHASIGRPFHFESTYFLNVFINDIRLKCNIK